MKVSDTEAMDERGRATDLLFRRSVVELFDGVLARPARRSPVRAGVFVLDLVFASETLADAYTASLLPELDVPFDVEIGVLGGSDVDLSSLIPAPASQSRTHMTESCFVVWHPNKLPSLYVLDRHARRGFIWFPHDAVPEWELSRPACLLIHALTTGTPYVIAHGGAVSRNGHCLLLAGKGRAGKTTAALACARAGWDYAGDDYFFADTRTGQVEPLYVSARLRVDMGGTFKEILGSSYLSNDDGESRHEIRVSRWLARERIAGGKIAAILLPRRRGASRPEFASATRIDAFNALFAITKLGLPGPIAWTFEKITRLVESAPAFFVDTGSAPEAIPDAFADFLDARLADRLAGSLTASPRP